MTEPAIVQGPSSSGLLIVVEVIVPMACGTIWVEAFPVFLATTLIGLCMAVFTAIASMFTQQGKTSDFVSEIIVLPGVLIMASATITTLELIAKIVAMIVIVTGGAFFVFQFRPAVPGRSRTIGCMAGLTAHPGMSSL